MAVCVNRNYEKLPNFIHKQLHYHIYTIQHHKFCAGVESIRIRTHNIPRYAEQMNRKIKMSASKRHSIPGAIHIDVINIKSDAEQSNHPIPKEIDKETVISWISAIIKSTHSGDIRAVKLIYSTIQSLHLSTVYPPIYHALICGHGKLGDIDTMLHLYHTLLHHHKANGNALPVVTSSIVTTVLSCLAMYRRTFEAITLFDQYLALPDSQPDIHAFCMMFRHCSFTANWHLSSKYFVKMYKSYKLHPNDLCFKYILETCFYCKPPKYEEAISILHGMESDWNIQPNVLHFCAVIRTLSTPFALIQNPLSQDVAVQIENNNDFQLYKFKLLHGRLFDNISVNKCLSDSDLQRCLDLFDEMTDVYGVIPNDKAFGELFYAMDKARNLEMALKYRQYWKRKFPTVRQQGYSFQRLLSICSSISSWNDAVSIYESTALIDDLYSYDGDTLQLQAHHKVQPEIGVFTQLLRCAKNDVSRQLFDGVLTKMEAEEVILDRIKYVQSQMYSFGYTPNDMTWVFLLQSAAMVESKDLCDRFLKRMFQFFMKPYQQKRVRAFMNWGENEHFYQQMGDKKMIPNEFADRDDTFANCWDYYDVNKFNVGFGVFQAIIAALFWSKQIEKAVMLYHDFYFVKQAFTHWHTTMDGGNAMDGDIDIDFHGYDPALAAIALLYIFQNEFESVYYNFLCQTLNDSMLSDLKDKNASELVINLKLNNNHEYMDRDLKIERRKGRNLKIITGKGTGNEEGTSILRPWIKLWLENEFVPPIQSYIHPRNVGVLVLNSNDVLAYIQQNRHKFGNH